MIRRYLADFADLWLPRSGKSENARAWTGGIIALALLIGVYFLGKQ